MSLDFGDGGVGFDEWGDVLDANGVVQPYSIESNSIGAIAPGDWGAGQNNTITVNAPESSWLGGLGTSLPGYVKTAVDAVKTGYSLSLAKDQLQAQNTIAQLGLKGQIATAQGQATVAGYNAQIAAQRAALQAQYPLGIPFTATPNGKLLVLAGVVGIALMVLHKQGAL